MRRGIAAAGLVLGFVLLLLPLSSRAQLADSPWPMFHQNIRHTGLSKAPYRGSATPSLAWSFRTGGDVLSSPAIGTDGRVFFGSKDHRIYGVHSNGLLSWSYRTEGPIGCAGPAIDADGRVYIGSTDHYIYCVTSDGNLSWRYKTAGPIECSPAIDDDGRVYIGSEDHRLYCFQSGGALEWTYKTGGMINSSPAIDPDGRVHVGSSDARMYQLDGDGNPLWSYATGGAVNSSPAIGEDGRVFFGSMDGRLYSLDSDGTLDWYFQTGASIGRSSPAIWVDGRVVIGSHDGYVYSIESDGTYDFSWYVGCEVDSSPAICRAGRIYPYVAQIDSEELIWKWGTGCDAEFNTLGCTFCPSPAIDIEREIEGTSYGRIYIGSADDNLYAISGPAEGPLGGGLNESSFEPGDRFEATFRLNQDIAEPFTAYAVVQLPDGSMLNARTLDAPLRPVARNVPGLRAGYAYTIVHEVPAGAPPGPYSVMAGCFRPVGPIHGPWNAFLLSTVPFTVE
ncbi:MAG: PQQ-binding-like beta-propeller repeat protein [bacterium]|nr:PQQ-binding-like beta-propeller repeat protein [bacterium]